MRDVAGHDDVSRERDRSGDRVFGEGGEGGLHSFVEIDFDSLELPFGKLGGDEAPGIFLELLKEDAVTGDFSLGLSVG